MSLVLDASITLAWTYAGENTDAVLRVFEIVKSEGASVPALWRWEIANALEMNAKRGRHGRDFSYEALAAFALFPILVDAECVENAWLDTLSLAERHGLTVYDAAYLELAIRRKIPLATLDRELRAAAESEGLQLLGG
jgi:predicted nucleic acid-binding protein